MSQENQLLLQEYSGLKDAYQLVLKEFDSENKNADYYVNILEKFSSKNIFKILEIHPLTEESYQIALRKNGYEVTSVALDMRINAVAGEKDGEHFIIGKDFKFPNFKTKFDAVILTHGCFGKFISITQTNQFLEKIFNCLNAKSLLIFEFWHLPGIDKSVTDKKGLRDWEKINSATEGSIMRFTSSKLHLDTSILSVDSHYIIEKNNELQKFNESHLWRLYTLSEIDLLITNLGFQFVKACKFPTLDEPDFSSFRLVGICEKL